MKKVFLPMTVVLFIVACGPRDVAVNGSKGGFSSKANGGSCSADRTKTFSQSEDGDRSPTCPADKDDYMTVYIPEGDLDAVLSGEITAALEAGNRNCYKIGTTATLKISGGTDEVGQVVIKKTEGLAVSDMTQKQANKFSMSVEDLQARGQDEIKKAANRPKGKFDACGMASITTFELVGGGSPQVSEKETISEILTFDKVGEKSTTCASTSDWTRVYLPATQDQSIIDNKVIAVMTAGAQNCFKVGSEVDLTEKGKGSPVRAKLKVAWVEIVPFDKLSGAQASAVNMNLVELKKSAQKMLDESKDKGTVVNLVYFEYLGPASK